MRVPVVRTVKKVILVVRHFWQPVGIFRIDKDVAGRAGATAATERKELIDAALPDHFHYGPPFDAIERKLDARATATI